MNSVSKIRMIAPVFLAMLMGPGLLARANDQEPIAEKLVKCMEKNSTLEQEIQQLRTKSVDNMKIKLLITSRRQIYFSRQEEAGASQSCRKELEAKCVEVADGRRNPQIADFGYTKAADASEYFTGERLTCFAICTYSRE